MVMSEFVHLVKVLMSANKYLNLPKDMIVIKGSNINLKKGWIVYAQIDLKNCLW